MLRIYIFLLFIWILTVLSTNNWLYAENRNNDPILGSWKIIKIDFIFKDLKGKDSLVTEGNKELDFLEKDNIGSILSFHKRKFYVLKKNKIVDSVNYSINNDSIFFLNNRSLDTLVNIQSQTFYIRDNILTIDMKIIGSDNTGVIRWTLKKYKHRQKKYKFRR